MMKSIRLYLQRHVQRRTWWDNAFLGLQLLGLGGGWWGESFDVGMLLMTVALGWYCATSLVVVLSHEWQRDLGWHDEGACDE